MHGIAQRIENRPVMLGNRAIQLPVRLHLGKGFTLPVHLQVPSFTGQISMLAHRSFAPPSFAVIPSPAARFLTFQPSPVQSLAVFTSPPPPRQPPPRPANIHHQ